MTVSVMQPYFFPYIGYYQLAANCEKFVFLDDVNFIKKGWINRNRILVQGEPYLFSLALSQVSQWKAINQIEIAEYPTKFLKTLQQAYGKAPFYEPVLELIKSALTHTNIAGAAMSSIQQVVEYLQLGGPDWYKSSQLGIEGKGQDRIIAICKELGATEYVNPSGGVDLYNYDDFKARDLKLGFLKPKLDRIIYHQNANVFSPGLSMIDILMRYSPEVIQGYLKEYEVASG